MSIRRYAIQWLTYAAAILGGLALVINFARFNVLHDEFISASFDGVHGARTLLKTGFFLELVVRDVDSAATDTLRRPTLLATAAENMRLAENHAAGERDREPALRAALLERIQQLRTQLNQHRQATDPDPGLATTLTALRQLSRDVGTAEQERWGALSAANAALGERVAQVHIFIVASIGVFLLIMAVLGWSLARTRRTEADLLQAKADIEATQRTTLDASSSGIAYVDAGNPAHRFVKLVNSQMAAMFSYTPETMCGLNVSRLYGDRETYDRFSHELPPRLQAGEVVREEVLMRRRQGELFWCSLSIKAIDPTDFSRGVVWTCEDISERKKTETQLRLAMETAEAASLAKSDFLANMSHELRTPFAGILGLLDLLQRGSLNETQQRYIRLARDSTTQMLAIVSDILDFSKIEAGKLPLDPVVFDLRRFFTRITGAAVTAAADKRLSVVLDLIEPLPDFLEGDTVRIRQIVDNLVGNAIKFTDRGEIRLRVACPTRDESSATLCIDVSDTGIGIAPEMCQQIFHKFTQADSATTRLFGGTGLGLAICRQLVNLMAGEIKVTSTVGAGSNFQISLRLPVATAAAALKRLQATAVAPADVSGILVLLVDDNAINRNVFSDLLTHFGCAVETAENGEQAIRLAQEIRPDVILMDCQMPVIDGQEASRRIRASEQPGEHVPIIALTAHATSIDRERSLAAGMDDYVAKPVSPEVLLRKIAQWRIRSKGSSASGSLAEFGETLPWQLPGKPGLVALRGRILLVEDNAAIQEATRRLIELSGCQVQLADNGLTALELLQANAGTSDFDLVLMDCRLPELDGWEATRRWRAYEEQNGLNPTAIVALSGCNLPETRLMCQRAGMNDFVLKPFDETRLFSVLTTWLSSP